MTSNADDVLPSTSRDEFVNIECVKLESDNEDDPSLPSGYEPIDGVEIACVKTESNDDNDSTLSNENLSRKKKKACKRKAEPLEDDVDNKKSKKHLCSAVSLIKFNYTKQLVKPEIKPEVLESCQNLQSEGLEISPYALRMNDTCDKIINAIEQNNILKSTLSSLVLKFNAKLIDDPCAPKSYQWEKLVHNSIIHKVDKRIRKTAVSFMQKPNFGNNVRTIIHDLNRSVQFNGCRNQWNLYGSYLNGSMCKDSIIHLQYECTSAISIKKKKNSQSKVPQDLIQTLYTALEAATQFDCLDYSTSVEFPWIKLFHPRTKREIEITISTELNSVELRFRNSLLTKLYLDLNSNLKYLTIFLKLILQKYNVHGYHSSGKLTSYTLFWLVAFFMQQKKLLPSVIDVRKSAKIKHQIADWNCSLPENYSYQVQPAPITLYALLLEFFEYYRDFDFMKYLISPYLGRTLLLSDFDRLQIPYDEFSAYLKHVENPRRLSFSKNVMNLQDPSDLSFNVAGHLKLQTANQFKAVCHYLSDFLPSCLEEIEKMDCFCKLLPSQMEYGIYFPYNLTQYYSVVMNTTTDLGLNERREKKLNQMYILDAVRAIMELVFKFKKQSVVTAQNAVQVVFDANDEELVRQTFPVIYFEYYSTENTWENDSTYMKEIVPQNESEKDGFKVILTCEVCLEKHVIRFLVQSNADFVKFLSLYLPRLFRFALSKMVPVD